MSDLIERQAAIDALRREYNTDDSDYPTEYQLGLSAGRRIIDGLPSAQLDTCDGCKHHKPFGDDLCASCRRGYGDNYEG